MRLRRHAALLAAAICVLAACKREAPVATVPPSTATPPVANPPAAPQTGAPQSTPVPQPATPAAPATPPLSTAAVTSTTIGNAIGLEKRVTAATDTFRPQDTIFASIETSAGGVDLTARWTYDPQGQAVRVNEETQKVPPGAPSVTEFHIRKPDGWPAGQYELVVLMNGEPAATKRFTVK